jgi:hypothetical protein
MIRAVMSRHTCVTSGYDLEHLCYLINIIEPLTLTSYAKRKLY